MTMGVREKQRRGRRYLAGVVMIGAILFLVVGTLGPARHSPYYFAIVPPPALIGFALGWRAWSYECRSTAYSAAALVLLILVLILSHLLPRSAG
jgi:hypothetical protein